MHTTVNKMLLLMAMPLWCIMGHAEEEQASPEFSVTPTSWNINFVQGAKTPFTLGLNILMEGEGSLISSPGFDSGQDCHLLITDSCGKKIVNDSSHPLVSYSSKHVPGTDLKKLSFIRSFADLPSPGAEWLKVQGSWTVHVAQTTDTVMLEQTVKSTDEGQNFLLDLPPILAMTDGVVHELDGGNSVGLHISTLRQKNDTRGPLLVIRVAFPQDAPVLDLVLCSPTGKALPGLQQLLSSYIKSSADGETIMQMYYRMDTRKTTDDGVPPELPEFNVGIKYGQHIRSMNIPVDMQIDPTSLGKKTALPVVDVQDSLPPQADFEVTPQSWGYGMFPDRNGSPPSQITLRVSMKRPGFLITDSKITFSNRITVSTPGENQGLACRVEGTSYHSHEPRSIALDFEVGQQLPQPRQGWLLTGIIHLLTATDTVWTDSHELPLEQGKACSIQIPGKTPDSTADVTVQLHEIRQTTPFSAVFTLTGHLNSSFDKLHIKDGKESFSTRGGGKDAKKTYITFEFPAKPASFSCCLSYFKGMEPVSIPIHLKTGMGGVISDAPKKSL